MLKSDKFQGHALATMTALVWGMTLVASKFLLRFMEPLTIMILRFAVGTVVLFLLYPRPLKLKSIRHELLFAGAGFFGVSFYFLMETMALTYTTASNVSVIVCIAPMLTALGCRIFLKNEKLSRNFMIGFLFAILGVSLISFNELTLSINPLGDMLAVLAAASWAVYNIFMRKIQEHEYPAISSTRRVFIYGLFFLVICIPILGFEVPEGALKEPMVIISILFLGVLASAICYVTWNIASRKIGILATSVYIYVLPVISIIGASILLGESMTTLAIVGTALTIEGLVISEIKKKK